MAKKLIAYFSASGVTAAVAKTLADALGADLFEIAPAVPYTKADLNWNDRSSRSSVEMADPSSRPAVAARCEKLDDYDTVFVGFPIWWYVAPTIVNTFLEQYDWSGKTIVPFATSGGSGMGKTDAILKAVCPAARWLPGKRMSSRESADAVRKWLGTLAV